ncbi:MULTISPECIES: hypothetical protein [unclassified Cohnella]|uniref:phosphatase domain-containing putative toxin n=1 Tax=unclassified Cohnella TaxID=2636738 RepID=UPI00130448CB|nr:MULTISPECIES: hypothetical protein [unclassified Cohnella]
MIVDLRGEAAECAYPAANAKWIQIPLADNAAMPQEKAFEQAIQAVTQAYHQNKIVAFHYGGGKGWTGTVAAGTLLVLIAGPNQSTRSIDRKGWKRVYVSYDGRGYVSGSHYN